MPARNSSSAAAAATATFSIRARGSPAEGLYSATVIAPTAAEAEGLSTAFYVMGPREAGEFCTARPDIAALLVAPGEREGDVRLIALGLDNDQWLRLADS